MPLVITNTDETSVPKRLVWDVDDPVETMDMLDMISELESRGYTVSEKGEGTVVMMPPDRPDTSMVFRVLSENGDDRLVWDRKSPEQIQDAKIAFEKYLKKGYRAYVVRQAGGEKGSRIDGFDALLEELIMVKGSEALLVPPTIPG